MFKVQRLNGEWEMKLRRDKANEDVTTSTYAYGEHSGCATAALVWNSATNSSNRYWTANHLHILITNLICNFALPSCTLLQNILKLFCNTVNSQY